jgi:hypothetical protein
LVFQSRGESKYHFDQRDTRNLPLAFTMRL